MSAVADTEDHSRARVQLRLDPIQVLGVAGQVRSTSGCTGDVAVADGLVALQK